MAIILSLQAMSSLLPSMPNPASMKRLQTQRGTPSPAWRGEGGAHAGIRMREGRAHVRAVSMRVRGAKYSAGR